MSPPLPAPEAPAAQLEAASDRVQAKEVPHERDLMPPPTMHISSIAKSPGRPAGMGRAGALSCALAAGVHPFRVPVADRLAQSANLTARSSLPGRAVGLQCGAGLRCVGDLHQGHIPLVGRGLWLALDRPDSPTGTDITSECSHSTKCTRAGGPPRFPHPRWWLRLLLERVPGGCPPVAP